jgi:hypothetical protein
VKKGSSPSTIKSRCEVRMPGDDFFCIRYQVYYSSFDCAIRTEFRTSAGCSKCDQGIFNHKRHAAAIRRNLFQIQKVLP